MKTYIHTFPVSINAKPETVFAYVSDLTRHDEWNSGLTTQAVTPGPVSVGSQYRSWGMGRKRTVPPNEIRVTTYQPPTRFAFVAHDPGMGVEVTHEFTFSVQHGGTLVERTRTITHTSPLFEFVWRLIIWPLLGRPGMNKCMAALKANLEQSAV